MRLRQHTLAYAVNVVNRCGTRKLVINDPYTAQFRISGRIDGHNTDKFIRSLKPLHISARVLPSGPRSQGVILLLRSRSPAIPVD